MYTNESDVLTSSSLHTQWRYHIIMGGYRNTTQIPFYLQINGVKLVQEINNLLEPSTISGIWREGSMHTPTRMFLETLVLSYSNSDRKLCVGTLSVVQ